MLENIKLRFDQGGIEITFPDISLYTRITTEPVPMRIIDKDSNKVLG